MIVYCTCGTPVDAQAVRTVTGTGILYRIADVPQGRVVIDCPGCGKALIDPVIGAADEELIDLSATEQRR